MTDCGCEKAKRDLEEYIHHELERVEHADITEHLSGCIDCADELRVGTVLTERVRRACSDRAPEELRAVIVRELRLTIRH